MALRDRYAGTSAAPAVATIPFPFTPATAVSPPVSPAAPIVSVLGTRDLGALRAALAKGNTSPPEAAEALQAQAFEPKTRELPDGTAEPLVSVLPEYVGSAPPAAGPLPSTPTTEKAKRKRRTKAEMEAERAERAEAAEREAIVSECDVVSSGKGILDDEPKVTDFSLRARLNSITTDQLLGELLQRAQVGL